VAANGFVVQVSVPAPDWSDREGDAAGIRGHVFAAGVLHRDLRLGGECDAPVELLGC